MADLLLLIGICLIFWSVWQYRKKTQEEQGDIDRLQKELVQAREDVSVLMKELTGVSEQIVDTISEKIKEAQKTIEKLDSAVSERAGLELPKMQVNSVQRDKKVINIVDPKRENISRETTPNETRIDIGISAKHQAVYSLADMGYSMEEIARKLSIGKGEAALILQLKFKGDEADGL